MKIRHLILALCTAIAAAAQPVEAGFLDTLKGYFWSEQSPLPAIKVLVIHDQPGALLEVKGKYKVYDPNTSEHLTSRMIGKRQYLQALNTGIKWGEEFPGVHQLFIVPDDPNTLITIDGRPYKGSIYIYDIGGTISVVNQIPIEDYLMAVLTPTFNDETPPEALAAVAIAARTQAYYNSRYSKNKYWDVDARKVGFDGIGNVRPGAVAQAIDTTQNMVMSRTGVYEGVSPFPAQWGSMTGGKTSADDAVFARITLFDVEAMAKRGENAAQILAKAFPNTTIMLLQ